MKTTILTTLTLVLALGSASAATSADDKEIIAAQRPSYPLRACILTGKAFSNANPAKPVVFGGRLYLIASGAETKKLEAQPDVFAKRIEDAVVKQQKPLYPMETCVVSGEELGSMGDPIELVHGTRLVRLCCKGCKGEFAKNRAEYLEKVNVRMIENQRKTYPLDRCLVDKEKLADHKPIDHLYGVTLVRVCGEKCLGSFKENPDMILARLRKARGLARKGEAAKREG